MNIEQVFISMLTNYVTGCTFLVYFIRRIFAAVL
jgi:hypothetical protein